MNTIFTNCKDCAFLKRKDLTGNSSTTCSLGRLYQYENNLNCKIDYDEDDNPIIPNKICIAKRNINGEWYKENGENKEKVMEEIRIKYDIVLYISNESTIEQVNTSLKNISEQTFPIGLIHIIYNGDVAKRTEVRKLLEQYETLPYNIMIVLEKENDGSYISREKCIDMTVSQIENEYCSYYLLMDAGYETLHELEVFNNIINVDLQQIYLWEIGNLLIVNKMFHDRVLGHSPSESTNPDGIGVTITTGIINKAKLLAKGDEKWKKMFLFHQ